MNDKSKYSYYTTLTADIRYNNNLSDLDKILFSEIKLLAAKNGYCFIQDETLAELYNKHPNTINKRIQNLLQNKLIRIERTYLKGTTISTKRKIFIEDNEGINENSERGINENSERGINENSEYSNTSKEYYINNNRDFDLLLSSDNKLKSFVTDKYKIDNYSYQHYINLFIHSATSDNEKSIETFSKTSKQLKDWFKNWLNKTAKNNEIVNIVDDERNYDEIVDWYLKVFNKISRRNFKKKTGLETLLRNAKKEDYTHQEIILAIQNLYSQDDKRNIEHTKNGFKKATPKYLLSYNNLDIYLNMYPQKLTELRKLKKIKGVCP